MRKSPRKHYAKVLIFSVLFMLTTLARAQYILSDPDKPSVGNIYHIEGNIGIGTSTPQQLLHVYATGTSALRIASLCSKGCCNTEKYWNLTNDDGNLLFNFGVDLSPAQTFFTFTQNGNFGIGKTNPSTILDVNGTITATGGNSDYWNTAFSWGNHASAGYITDGNTLWDNEYGFITANSSETLANKSGNISMWTNDAGYLTSFSESDPLFSAHPANALTGDNIADWNTAFSWGNHASAGYITDGNTL